MPETVTADSLVRRQYPPFSIIYPNGEFSLPIFKLYRCVWVSLRSSTNMAVLLASVQTSHSVSIDAHASKIVHWNYNSHFKG
jgi:hypothetical protein